MFLCLLSLVRCAAVAIRFLLGVVGVVFGACMCLVCCNVVVSLVLSPLAWCVVSGVLSCLCGIYEFVCGLLALMWFRVLG